MKLIIDNSGLPQNYGFTLIELLVTIGILVLVMGMIMLNFNFFQNQSALDATTQEIISVLKLAQNKTLASENRTSFGVYFENDKYVIFEGDAYYSSSPNNDVRIINPSLKVSAVNLGGDRAVVFDRLSGTTADYGTIKIEQTSDSTKNKTIFIDSSGLIALAASLPDDLNRIKDSRHVEFAYDQNTQNAGTLSLFFPSAGITQDIDYQSYLNAGKTQFYWEGTINVSGADQKIKIHTLDLTSSDATFSVHRDRRYNTQALTINLDGQNLINYSATGTTTRGTSIWAGEPMIQ